MRPYGGFDHNDQTLRILVLLERHYAEFDGLNLTWEMLEGIVKHNGPMMGPYSDGAPLPPTLADYNGRRDLDLDTFAGPEAQAAAIADDVAYDHHDIDDGLRAGLLTVADLDSVPHVAAVFHDVRARYRSEEHTSELQSLMRISYAVFCLKKKKKKIIH